MLTCRTVSAEKAKDYYTQAYYLEGTSRWWGTGAGKLKLSGAVTDETAFTRVLKGISPSGRTKLTGRDTAQDTERRAALDCTFNAPKSVSLQALVGGDERLVDAHRTAVNQTLELIQRRYSHTRVRTGGERQIVTTGNLIVAQFDHVEARKIEADTTKGEKPQETPDPHLHTHCLIMNATEVERGKWYSHLNEAIYANKKLLGMAYQHYLALEVQKLGYEVEATGQGQFDLKGFAAEDLIEFSKRRQKILEVTGNSPSAKRREAARIATRAWKQRLMPEELQQKWREEAARLGIQFLTPKQPQPETTVSSGDRLNTNPPNARERLNTTELTDAIAHCSERAVAFKPEEMEKFVLSQSPPTDITEVEAAIASHPDLIKVPEFNRSRYTTQQAVQREIATIRLMQQGKGKMAAIQELGQIQGYFAVHSLTAGQRQAIALSLSSSDQFLAWQGVAGAGKTYALKLFVEIATKNGGIVRGFAPSAEAAKVLGEIGIETETVARLLYSASPEISESNQIWIVDEAGLLSAQAAYDLMQMATQERARVIFVGDTRQLSGVEAGNSFKSLQQRGMATAYLEQSLRQRTPQLHLAVDLIAQGKIEEGFARLEQQGCIEEVGESKKAAKICADYLALSPKEREKTLILAGTNQERLAITRLIREGLKAEGKLGQSVAVTQLKAKDLTKVQLRYAHNFEVGDVIVPLKSYARRGLERGKQYQVVGKEGDRVVLRDGEGNATTVDLGFEKAAYSQCQLEIAEGDKLKWTKNERLLGRRNGQEFRVVKIEGNAASIEYRDGSISQFEITSFLPLDYAIASTTYSSQGKTADRALIAADTTVSQESFYVAVSRVRDELKLYTTDREELLAKAMESRAKENALEVLLAAASTTTGQSKVPVGAGGQTQQQSVTPPSISQPRTAGDRSAVGSPVPSVSPDKAPPPPQPKPAAARQTTSLAEESQHSTSREAVPAEAKPALADSPAETVKAKPALADSPAETVKAKPALADSPAKTVTAKPAIADFPAKTVTAKPALADSPAETVATKSENLAAKDSDFQQPNFTNPDGTSILPSNQAGSEGDRPQKPESAQENPLEAPSHPTFPLPPPQVAAEPQDARHRGDYQPKGFTDALAAQTSENPALPELRSAKLHLWRSPEERRQQLYRLVYQDLALQVRERPDFAHAEPAAIDVAVAYTVLTQPRLVPDADRQKEVKSILSESDTARQWRESMPEADYQQQFSAYVREVGEIAREIEEAHRTAIASGQCEADLDWER